MVIFLLLSIVFSTLTVSFFKLFELKGVRTFEAIVFNYLSCGIVGSILADKTVFTQAVWATSWYPYTLFLGFLFISIFLAIGLTAQRMGVSVSMVAAKLSVMIPVIVAILLYKEQPGILQLIGIVFSLVAVVIMSTGNQTENNQSKLWYLPVLVFVGSGMIDSLLHFLEKKFIPAYSADTLVTTVFLNAFLLGSLALLVGIFRGKEKPDLKSALWGIALGIPNYFSMYFLVKTLEVSGSGTYVFPVNNIGIVLASTLSSMLIFKEQMNNRKWLGLGLAIVAIILLSVHAS